MMTTSPRPRNSTDAIFLGLLVSCLLAAGCFLLSAGASFPLQDWRCFYCAGQMLRHCPTLLFDVRTQQHWQQQLVGGDMILPFYHPAYEALLYLPFTGLSFRIAYFVYAAVNLLLLWLCYLAAPRAVMGTRPAAIVFLGFPLLLTVLIGQNALWMLLAVCLAWRAQTEGRDDRTGILLGLVSFKLAVILPLAFFVTLRRGRRVATAFGLTFAVVMALSCWLTGAGATREFLHLIARAAVAGNQAPQQQVASAVWLRTMPDLAGLLYLLGSERLGSHAAFALNLAALLPVAAVAAWVQRRSKSDATAFSTAVVATVLISPHLNMYDLSLLVLPFLLLSHRWLKYVALLWFLLPPALYAIGHLTWFAPVVIVPLLLFAVCLAQLRREQTEPATSNLATPAYSHSEGIR
jgi:hypothetical protein